jgi:hypothetical protein
MAEPEISEEAPSERVVNAADWHTAPLVDLYKQLDVLTDRYAAAVNARSPNVARQLTLAIETLRAIIDARDVERSKIQTIFF